MNQNSDELKDNFDLMVKVHNAYNYGFQEHKNRFPARNSGRHNAGLIEVVKLLTRPTPQVSDSELVREPSEAYGAFLNLSEHLGAYVQLAKSRNIKAPSLKDLEIDMRAVENALTSNKPQVVDSELEGMGITHANCPDKSNKDIAADLNWCKNLINESLATKAKLSDTAYGVLVANIELAIAALSNKPHVDLAEIIDRVFEESESLSDVKENLIAALSAREGWISVEDRLPPRGAKVLVYIESTDLDNIPSVEAAYFDTCFHTGNDSPSHWQPLPTPPQESE